MIPGFLDPWEPLFRDLYIQNYFLKSKKDVGTFLKAYCFCECENQKIEKVGPSAFIFLKLRS